MENIFEEEHRFCAKARTAYKNKRGKVNAVKEMFEMPKLDIIALADEDIIRTSTPDRGQWDINVKSGINAFAKIDDRDE